MNDPVEQRARKDLEEGSYQEALDDSLRELAQANPALAKTLYRTHRRMGMYKQSKEWADEVLRCSREHILIMPDIYQADISGAMDDFETEYEIEKDPSLIPPNLQDALSIITVENGVRPSNLTPERIEKMEKELLKENFFIEFLHQNNRKEWNNRTYIEKVEWIRERYSTHTNSMKTILRKTCSMIAEIDKIMYDR